MLPPLPPPRQRLATGWLASAFGIVIAFATGVDLLTDLGIAIIWPPVGAVLTGLLLGQGAKFSLEFLRGLPGAHPA